MPTPWNPVTVAVTEQDRARGRKRAQRMYPLTECEGCGTKEKLSRDHRDGNPLNNAPENVAILCLSCHTTKEWRTGVYADRPKPILVRGLHGRIMGTLPTRSPREPQPKRMAPGEASPLRSEPSASGHSARKTADPEIPSRSSKEVA